MASVKNEAVAYQVCIARCAQGLRCRGHRNRGTDIFRCARLCAGDGRERAARSHRVTVYTTTKEIGNGSR